MSLLYKPDWEETKERYKAWWAHEVIDRCAIAVCAWNDDPSEEPPRYTGNPAEHWFDFDYHAARNDYEMRHTFYGGEAFPVWSALYPGWAAIPHYLGCKLMLDETTGWWDPFIDSGELIDHDYRKLVIDQQSHWWQLTMRLLEYAEERTRGKSIPTIGAFGGCGDTLAAIRGTLPLLTDVLDCPDYVREFELYLMRQWIEVYEAFHQVIREVSEGSTCWFSLWSPGKFYAVQNDFSYMISPKTFREVFMPALEMQTNYLDHAVYHVDGVGAFAHVDAICELPHLQALQILPGAGKPSPLHYMDVLKKVQAYGKNLHISIPINEVETALQELSPVGLFIDTWAPSEADARDLLKKVAHWSAKRVY